MKLDLIIQVPVVDERVSRINRINEYIKIVRAEFGDIENLTKIQKLSFDNHAKKWGGWTADSISNGPGGYDSVEYNKYCLQETYFYKILYKSKIVGGISISYPGARHAVIDKIFVDPEFQNRSIGIQR